MMTPCCDEGERLRAAVDAANADDAADALYRAADAAQAAANAARIATGEALWAHRAHCATHGGE